MARRRDRRRASLDFDLALGAYPYPDIADTYGMTEARHRLELLQRDRQVEAS